MAGLTDSLRILITANGAQAEREFSKVGAASRKSLGQAETNAQKYSKTMTSAGIAMTAFGVVALAGLAKAAGAAEEEHAALLRLQNSIRNMPELAGASTDAFLAQAAALQDVTKFEDDATVSAQAMLGTFHLTEKQIIDLIPAVQDYASKFGVDLVTASKQVGRAVSGSSGALTRNGIVMDEAAFAADHYGTVLGALRENAGGFAREEGQTLSGQIQILKNNMMDLVEGLGAGATDVFGQLAGGAKTLSGAFDHLDPATQNLIGRVVTWGAVALTAAGAATFLAGQMMKLAPIFSSLASAGPRLYAAIADMIVPTQALTVGMGDLAAAETAAGTAGGAAVAPALLLAGAIVAVGAGLSVAVEKAGDFLGQDWSSGFSGIHKWADEVERVIAANPDLVSALSSGKQAMDMFNDGTAEASTNLDALSQEISDYLDGVYDLPEANRAVTAAFDDLFATLLTEGHTADDVAESMQGIVEATAGVISAGGDADAVARRNILTLRDQYDQGLINQQDYRDQRQAILNIPGVSRTLFDQPGMPEAQVNTIRYRGLVVNVPQNWATTFQANTGSAISSIQQLIDRIHTLNNTVVRPQGGGIAAQVGQITAGVFGKPGESSRVVGAGELAMAGASASSAGGGRASIVVNFNGPTHQDDGEKVVAAIQRFERRNGRGWRN